MATSNDNQVALALDVGKSRVGVATANLIARISHPWGALTVNEHIIADIVRLIAEEQAAMVVLGLPRGLSGQETDQTKHTREFAATLKKATSVPLYFQDEALTSHKAEQELAHRKKPYSKGDIDALAATYILEDFLQQSNPDETRV